MNLSKKLFYNNIGDKAFELVVQFISTNGYMDNVLRFENSVFDVHAQKIMSVSPWTQHAISGKVLLEWFFNSTHIKYTSYLFDCRPLKKERSISLMIVFEPDSILEISTHRLHIYTTDSL